jgi:hypothetical protein
MRVPCVRIDPTGKEGFDNCEDKTSSFIFHHQKFSAVAEEMGQDDFSCMFLSATGRLAGY